MVALVNVQLKVEGMSCGHCVSAVEKAIAQIGAKARVNLEQKLVSIDFDAEQISLDALYSAIQDQGYEVID